MPYFEFRNFSVDFDESSRNCVATLRFRMVNCIVFLRRTGLLLPELMARH